MTATPLARPDTVLGRAINARTYELADTLLAAPTATVAGEIDLTAPEEIVVPEHVQTAAGDALDRGETHYTTRPGVIPLRAAIAERLTADGFPAATETLLITNGGAEALYIALQMLVTQARRIVVAGPVLPNVVPMIRFVGAEPVLYPSGVATRFFPDVASVAATEGAALLLSSPSPVTGLALSSADQEAMIAAAVERGMPVIFDRTLATTLYDPQLARFNNPELGARLVSIGSFSAGYGMAGWRVGWLSAPSELANLFRDLKQAMSISSTSVSQWAALAAVEGPQERLDTRRAELMRRRDWVVDRLGETPLMPVVPDAYPALLIDVRAVVADDRRFAGGLRAAEGVVVEPGATYGPDTAGYVRIDLGGSEATLTAGIERLARFAAQGSVA